MYYKKNIIVIMLMVTIVFLSSSTIYAADTQPATVRLGGRDRFETNAMIVQEGWQSADTVVVVRGTGKDKFADALSAGLLAYQYDAPILLVDQNRIPQSIEDTLVKLKPKNAFIIGGTGVVSDEVAQQLESFNIRVERIGGADRRETAVKVADRVREKANFDTVILATGKDFPDALSAAPFSAMYNMPVLFTTNKINEYSLDDINRQALNRWGVKKVIIVGGPIVISNSIEVDIKYSITGQPEVIRLGGINRYETSLNIVKHFDQNDYQGIMIATGKDFPDLLAGAVFAAKNKTPILLADDKPNLYNTVEYLISRNFSKRYVLGGEGVISQELLDKIFSPVNTIPVPEKPTFENSIEIASMTNTDEERVSVKLRWLSLPEANAYRVYSADGSAIAPNKYALWLTIPIADGYIDSGYFYPATFRLYKEKTITWFKIEAVDSNGKVIGVGEIKIDLQNVS
jgi:putative cell wall-binding protein